jgi:hypothetical protein
MYAISRFVSNLNEKFIDSWVMSGGAKALLGNPDVGLISGLVENVRWKGGFSAAT